MGSKHCRSSITFGDRTVSLLTWTTDMAAWSFSLPAGPNGACPLAVLGENSVCGSCYAQLSYYNQPVVMNAQYARFGWVKTHLKDAPQVLVNTLVNAINKHSENGYFRWFDSGDFFDPRLIDVAIAVCKATPHIRHWFPSRTWVAKSEIWQEKLAALAALPNVALRPSGLYFNDKFPKIAGWASGTNVVTSETGTTICPKTLHGGNCETNKCRKCWSKRGNVSYLVHGVGGRSSAANAMGEQNQLRRSEQRKQVMLTINRSAVA